MHDELPEVEKEGSLSISEEEWVADTAEECMLNEYLGNCETR